MSAGVPAEAITAGAAAIWPPTRYGRDEQHCRITAARVLEAAAPAIATQAAAAERARILVSDETLHADGSIGPDTAPPWGGDAAYWYRRWLFAVKQLDEEGSQRISAYVGMREHLDEVAAAAGANVAADRIRLEERARIRRLALDCDATYCEPCHDKRSHTNGYSERESFADLLDGAS